MKRSGNSITERDHWMVADVKRLKVVTASHLQELWFGKRNLRGCNRRLLKLYKLGLVKRVSTGLINDPYFYYVSRMPKPSSFSDHSIGITDIRVRVERSVKDLDWQLLRWLNPDSLQPLLA